jgi:hypothetical protein
MDRPSVRPNYGDPGGFEPSTFSLAGIRLPWNRPGQPFYSDAGELLDELIHRFERLTDSEDLEKILQRLLGPQCFTLGVVYGIGEAFVVNIADLLGLVKTFLLAEFYDVTRRNPSWTVSHPGGLAAYLTAQLLNEYFGEEIANAALERDALIFELKYAFEHPEEFFGRLAEEYSDKFRLFLKFSSDPSLESQFQAGSIFGGLLLDVLAVIGTGAALVKFAGRIPKLARLAGSLKGKVARRTVVAGGTSEAAGGPPPLVKRPAAKPMKEPKAIVDEPAVETKPKKTKSLRERYMGDTPGKGSATGKQVQDRMRAEGKLRDGPDGPEFQATNGRWYDLSEADMSHKTDAVKWWNEEGRKYGPKSAEVRKWMLDPDNYELDHFSINRSKGGALPDRYQAPLP